MISAESGAWAYKAKDAEDGHLQRRKDSGDARILDRAREGLEPALRLESHWVLVVPLIVEYSPIWHDSKNT